MSNIVEMFMYLSRSPKSNLIIKFLANTFQKFRVEDIRFVGILGFLLVT